MSSSSNWQWLLIAQAAYSLFFWRSLSSWLAALTQLTRLHDARTRHDVTSCFPASTYSCGCRAVSLVRALGTTVSLSLLSSDYPTLHWNVSSLMCIVDPALVGARENRIAMFSLITRPRNDCCICTDANAWKDDIKRETNRKNSLAKAASIANISAEKKVNVIHVI